MLSFLQFILKHVHWGKPLTLLKYIGSVALLICLGIFSNHNLNISDGSLTYQHFNRTKKPDNLSSNINLSATKNNSHVSFHTDHSDKSLEKVLQQVPYSSIDISDAFYNMEFTDLEEDAVPGLGEEERHSLFLQDENTDILRDIPDTRDSMCLEIKYDISLPTFSVIIAFSKINIFSITNTLDCLINKTSSKLMKEIILVDDGTENTNLHVELEMHIVSFLPFSKIKLLRLSKRSGLIKAKLIGAHEAVGDVLVFLDDDSEVQTNWSEPLLQKIKDKRNTVVVPMVDVIDGDQLRSVRYNHLSFSAGGFTWTGKVKWTKIFRRPEEYNSVVEPMRTPTIPLGVFAIDRKYFWDIGSFDPDMLSEGGADLELSFRIWQCGGSIAIIPCSRIAHTLKDNDPNPDFDLDYRRDALRTAAAWMDDYKQFVYERGMMMDFGNVDERVAFRKKQKCESFQWYLDTVYREMFRLHLDSKLWGQVSNIGSSLCLRKGPEAIISGVFYLQIAPCNKLEESDNIFYLSYDGELRKDEFCARSDWNPNKVILDSCDITNGDAFKWDFDVLGRLVNKWTGLCLTVTKDYKQLNSSILTLRKCGFSYRQKWYFPYSDLGSNI